MNCPVNRGTLGILAGLSVLLPARSAPTPQNSPFGSGPVKQVSGTVTRWQPGPINGRSRFAFSLQVGGATWPFQYDLGRGWKTVIAGATATGSAGAPGWTAEGARATVSYRDLLDRASQQTIHWAIKIQFSK